LRALLMQATPSGLTSQRVSSTSAIQNPPRRSGFTPLGTSGAHMRLADMLNRLTAMSPHIGPSECSMVAREISDAEGYGYISHASAQQYDAMLDQIWRTAQRHQSQNAYGAIGGTAHYTMGTSGQPYAGAQVANWKEHTSSNPFLAASDLAESLAKHLGITIERVEKLPMKVYLMWLAYSAGKAEGDDEATLASVDAQIREAAGVKAPEQIEYRANPRRAVDVQGS
jgi:hypothetical protein